MALLNFPSNPNVGDTYTIGNRTWVWNGSGWQLQSGITSYDPFTANRVVVTTSTNSTSTLTGGLLVYGGIGLGLDMTVGGAIHIIGTATSTSTTTGALTVAGDVAIAGRLYGSELYDNGSRVITQASLPNQGVTALYAGTDTAVSTQTGIVYVWNTSTLASVTSRGNTTTAAIGIFNVFDADNTYTGALTVEGGVGIGKSVRIGGNEYIDGRLTVGGQGNVLVSGSSSTVSIIGTTATSQHLLIASATQGDAFAIKINNFGYTKIGTFGNNANGLEFYAGAEIVPALRLEGLTGQVQVVQATSATSTTTGALTVAGGAGFGDAIYIGKTSYVNNYEIVTSGTIAAFAVTNLTAGTDTAVSTSTGAVVVWNTSTLQTVTDRGNLTTNFVKISNGTAATDQSTGALIVTGGVGIGGDVYASNIFSNGSQVVTQANLGFYGVASLTAGTDTAVSTSTGPVVVWSTATLESITRRGSETSQAIFIGNATSSTDWTTGALRVFGGVGIGGNLNVNGTISATGGYLGLNPAKIYQNTSSVEVIDTGSIHKVVVTVADTTSTIFSNTTTEFILPVLISSTATSAGTTSGALVVSGGVGVGGSVNVANTSYIGGQEILTTVTVGTYVITTVNAGTDTAATSSGRTITIWNTSTLQSVTSRGSQTNHVVTFANTANAVSTTSAAVIITGGLATGKDIWIGGNSTVLGDTTLVGNLTVLGTQTTIYSTATSIQDPTISLGAPTDFAPLSTDDGLDKGVVVHYNTGTTIAYDTHAFFGFQRSTEKFVYLIRTPQFGRTGIDNPFTSYSQGGALFANITLGGGEPANNINSGDLVVSGGAGIGGSIYVGGNGRIQGTTTATSTTTGALTVVGGLGVGARIYAGDTIYSKGAEVLTTASIGSAGVGVVSINAGTDTAVSTQSGAIVIWNTSTLQSVTSRGSSTTFAISILDSTAATTTTNGSLVVTGGVGIGLQAHIGGDVRIWSTTSQALVVGGSGTFGGNGSFTGNGSFGGTLTVSSTATSSNSTSGAFIVGGGAGIGGNVNASGDGSFGGKITAAGTATLGTNLLLGAGAVTRDLAGSQFISNGYFSTAGDAQSGIYMLRGVNLSTGTTALTFDGISVSTVNQIALPNNSTYTFKIQVTARSTNSQDEAGWLFDGVVTRYSGPGTTVIRVVNKTKLYSSAALWDCNVVADTVNGALQILGSGDGTRNIRFVARVDTVEVTN